MKKLIVTVLASLAGLLLTAAPSRAVEVIVPASIVTLATNGTNYYTFPDSGSGESVIVRVVITPFSSGAGDVFTLRGGATRVAIGPSVPPPDLDGDAIDGSEGVDFSATLMFASTGVDPGSVEFQIGSLGMRGSSPGPNLVWSSPAGPPLAFPVGPEVPYLLDAVGVPLGGGVTYTAQLRHNPIGSTGTYQLSDVAGPGIVMHVRFNIIAADPHANSWITQDALRYARVYTNTSALTNDAPATTWTSRSGLTQAFPAYSGVQQIHSTVDDVYVLTTDLGHEVMGPWNGGAFPNLPTNQKSLWRFPRAPVIPDMKTYTPAIGVGYFVDGVAIFDPWSAKYYDGTNDIGGVAAPGGYWNCNAFRTESTGFDGSLSHPQQDGIYHNHANPLATRYLVGDHVDFDPKTNSYSESGPDGKHSPIIGWMSDGFPLYGPYGYSNALDPHSSVVRMRSGFVLRDGSHGTTNLAVVGRSSRPLWEQRLFTPTNGSPIGPDVTNVTSDGMTNVLGWYIEDYDYLGDHGYTQGKDFDLDQFNGRWCVTPEFPMGTYAYFVTIDTNLEPAFPYMIGRAFYGDPKGGAAITLPAGATTLFDSMADLKPQLDSPALGTSGSGTPEVTLTWTDAIEGGQYQVEASHDLMTWTSLGGLVTATDTKAATTIPLPSPVPDHQSYRLELNEIDHFDAAKGPPTVGTPGGGIVSVSPDSMVAGPIITLDIALATPAPPGAVISGHIEKGTDHSEFTILGLSSSRDTVTAKVDLEGLPTGEYDVVLDFGLPTPPTPPRRDRGFIVH